MLPLREQDRRRDESGCYSGRDTIAPHRVLDVDLCIGMSALARDQQARKLGCCNTRSAAARRGAEPPGATLAHRGKSGSASARPRTVAMDEEQAPQVPPPALSQIAQSSTLDARLEGAAAVGSQVCSHRGRGSRPSSTAGVVDQQAGRLLPWEAQIASPRRRVR